MLPKFWGGKTYIFFNYEGFRFPTPPPLRKPCPQALMRAGVIQLPNSAGVETAYNLNPKSCHVEWCDVSAGNVHERFLL